jgi:tRNA dimethylallyltransferase
MGGPTGVGKSAVALELALRLGGEIISVDSMQVYRGMDIGTAKPSAADRARVPHHLIDVVNVRQSFDAAEFVRHAQAAGGEVGSRGRVSLFCGGTGLYFKAYLYGLGHAPPANPVLRHELEATPMPALLDELQRRDPAGYRTVDKANRRRVVRALEVVRLTGRPFSEQRASWNAACAQPGRVPPIFFGLRRSPEDLRRRIDVRVDAMFAAGLIQETAELSQRGLAENPTAAQALGYRQVLAYLRGEQSRDDTIAEVKLRTRQYAKRQMTWFRFQPALEWIEVTPDDPPERVAARIQERYVERARG